MRKYYATLALVTLSACSPSMDMQGEDPREYYTQHPIVNTVETRTKTVVIHYSGVETRLSPDETDNLTDSLHAVSMLAIKSIRVGFSSADKNVSERKLHLTKLLRNLGYTKGEYVFESLPALKSNEVQLVITYAVVVSPDCPDWRTSPVTTHSNTTQGNFSCASQVNLGIMVADPNDLVHGTEEYTPIDTPTADKAIQDYHEGKASAASQVSASGGTSTTGASSSAVGNTGQ